ncbi:tetratricopeptide repeat protein [Chondrinema litorale]|uniref:tetratricopeptide repeat protein n=1 Tax=Chondrinema litorale TaxID=2994555 RepID=UPI00254301F6|nr:tetratricopeptide repeat protein [Chondrinema litorale]UZR99225.1 tetratricopeptide repeat protein [Chondrinema litorale]
MTKHKIFFPSVFLIFLIIELQGALQAQTTEPLLSELKQFSVNHDKIKYIEKQLDSLYHLEPELAMAYTHVADSILAPMDSLAGSLEIERYKALILREQGKLKDGELILEKALERIPKKTDRTDLTLTKGKILIALSSIYRRQGDFQIAIEISQQSIRLLDSLQLSEPDNFDFSNQLSKAYNGIAITHARWGHYENSNYYFQKALEIDKEFDFIHGINSVTFNIGANFFQTEQYDSAEYYWLKVINHIDTTSQTFMSDAIYLNLGTLATKQKRWNDAKKYYQMAMDIYESRNDNEGQAKIHEALASMYCDKGQYKQAEKEALEGLKLVSQQLRVKTKLHATLADIYKEMANYRKAFEYAETYALLQDSLLSKEKTEAIVEMEAKFKNEQQQKELALQRSEIELLNRNSQIRELEINILVLSILLLLIVGFFIFRWQRLKVNRKHDQLKNSQALMTTIKENAQLKEQQLRMELEHRDQQLTSYTLNFIQKNELMTELQEKIESLQSQKQWSPKDFRQLKNQIQQHVSIDRDWENFKMHFESVHPDFFHNLVNVFPNLSPKELKLCALVRLNLNIKESAAVLSISPDSVKTARHRLRKKMNIETETTILDVLMQVEKGIFNPPVTSV